MLHDTVLSLLIWLPVMAAIVLVFLSNPKHESLVRWIALSVSLISLLLCVYLWVGFDTTTAKMQFVELTTWIPALRINYYLGVDGISMPFVVLTVFTTLIVVMASWTMVKQKVAQYLAAFLVMQAMIVGVFCALDSMLFYFFWEGMLIPMYLSIGIWGGPNRSYAAIKFFLYTFLGSALMLIALLYLRMHPGAGTFNILSYFNLPLTKTEQLWLFGAFFLAFAIKVPMWPFHTWLPDAHTEAPAGGSVILAALMLKLGGYGFLRFCLPVTPDACHFFQWWIIGLSLVAVVYVGFIALAQTDMKKLIAYSSVAHMGFATLGCFMCLVVVSQTHNLPDAYLCLEGAMTQMISHAFGSGAMFLAFGMIYEQLHSRQIADFGGIAKTMPYFAAFFMVFAMSNVGLPGTSGFVGEFMIILSTFKANFWVTFLAASTLVIGAAYTLWMVKRVFFGAITNPAVENLQDVSGVNWWVLAFLVAPLIFIGVYPNPLLNVFHQSIHHLLTLSTATKI